AFAMELAGQALQTDDAALTGGPDTDTKGVGDLFNVTMNDPGEDGLGALVYSLELGSNAGSVTLKDTATGNTVFLFDELGDIVGREGTNATDAATGDVVFSVSVNSSTGAVTLTQERAVEHSSADTSGYASDITGLGAGLTDAINLVGTLSDAETAADTASASVDLTQKISFTDDGPAFAMELAGQALQTDDADLTGGPDTDTEGVGDLFNVTMNDPGEDGLGALVYSLELGSNAGSVTLKDTATGNTVFLFDELGDIVGREGTNATDAATGDVVFSVSVNSSTGAVTLTQERAVEHSSADTSGYASDVTGLGAALTDAIRLVGTLSDAETAADTATDYVDLTQKISFTDDGPQITVNDASGSYEAGAQGTWSDSPGADAFDSLDIELVSYEIDDNGTVVVNADLTQDLVNPNLFSGSITDDFNGDGVDETVDFTIEFDSPTTYDLQVSTPPGSVVELSTADGSLDAGGPDPVRTLTIDTESIVFAAVEPTSTPGEIQPFLNTLEANWEGSATFLSAEQMNVSTSGIGNGNNNLNGNANHGIDGDTTSGGKVDESFVVDPTDFDVSAVKVFIDNSVGGYDNPPEDLWYTIYYSDGTPTSGPIEVLDGDLSSEAGGQESFVIGDPTGPNNIDAIQLFMGQGTIKIPVIEFTTSQEFNPESLEMTLNATETDGDSDTDTDGFTIDLEPVVA
uniref:DUF5801 repeats-in-toxin domain-containing protein n=1 Tax=Ruegeria lacuscaerulensis TaxID=55218 RepID=UPI001BE3CFF4